MLAPTHASPSPVVIVTSPGGTVTLPPLVLIDRADGGHLVVQPPRVVWDRSELTSQELASWGALVAATGAAMLACLPQLGGGCINYWDAGNWSLHHDSEPAGPKSPRDHRHVHQHLFGRSREAAHPSWQWGEAPAFPRFADRRTWARDFRPFTPEECVLIRRAVERRLG